METRTLNLTFAIIAVLALINYLVLSWKIEKRHTKREREILRSILLDQELPVAQSPSTEKPN